MNWSGFSQAGKTHRVNQDAWRACVQRPDNGYLFVVCDGVSSAEKAKEAASLTCDRLADRYASTSLFSSEDIEEALVEIDWELRGMGRGVALCTVALIWIKADRLYVFAMGDTEIFELNSEGVHALTPAYQRHRGLRGCLGLGFDTRSATLIRSRSLQPDSSFLILTDGISTVLSHEQILECHCHAANAQVFVELLVQNARFSGATDDLTAVSIRMSEVG